MSAKKNTITLTVICLLGLAALSAGFFISQHLLVAKKINLAQFHGTYLEKPREIKPFHLRGIDNKPFDNSKLHGQWTFVFFGFTQCGSICPTTMAELGKMYGILEKKQVPLPRVLMISIDPERDTLERLDIYVHAFNPNFFGARGSEERIHAMTEQLGIVYQKVLGKHSKNYDIQHSGAVMLFNPEGQLNAFFTLPHQANQLAKDYMLLVS